MSAASFSRSSKGSITRCGAIPPGTFQLITHAALFQNFQTLHRVGLASHYEVDRALPSLRHQGLPDSHMGAGEDDTVLRGFDDLELLDSPAPVRLGDVDVAFGIDGQGVTVGEIAELMAGTAEGR